MEPNQPDNDREIRVAELLQAFFDRNISEEGAKELLILLDADASLADAAIKNRRVEKLFRFRDRLRKTLPPLTLERFRELARKEFGLTLPEKDDWTSPEQVETAELSDTDRLAWQAYQIFERERETLLRLESERRLRASEASTASRKAEKRRFPGIAWIAGLLVVATTVLVYREFQSGPERKAAYSDPPPVSVTGRLLGFQGVRWAVEPSCDIHGLDIVSNHLSTLSGKVALKLRNGAEILLDGTADMEILSSSKVDCRHGKFHLVVPPQSEPFRVRLPQFTVVVLGTAFIVEADEKGSTIHLSEGRVRLEDVSEGPITLEAGEALYQTPTGHVTKFEIVPEPTPVFRIWEKESTDRLSQWKRQRDRIRKDPASQIYLAFDRILTKENPSDRMNWGLGRFPGKWGLNFPEAKNDLSLRIDKDYPQATVMVWLRRETSAETRKMFFQTNSARWEFTSGGGIRWQTKNGNNATEIMPIPPELADQWMFVAVVLDAKAGYVKHYLNGKEMLVQRNAEPIARGPLKLGGGVRIDEFLFSERIYSAKEIEEIYSNGK